MSDFNRWNLADEQNLFKVIIGNRRVSIEVVTPGSEEYDRALETQSNRLRDAIETLREDQPATSKIERHYYFGNLAVAKNFAVMNIEAIQQLLYEERDDIADFSRRNELEIPHD